MTKLRLENLHLTYGDLYELSAGSKPTLALGCPLRGGARFGLVCFCLELAKEGKGGNELVWRGLLGRN